MDQSINKLQQNKKKNAILLLVTKWMSITNNLITPLTPTNNKSITYHHSSKINWMEQSFIKNLKCLMNINIEPMF